VPPSPVEFPAIELPVEECASDEADAVEVVQRAKPAKIQPAPSQVLKCQKGMASYYGRECEGTRTSSGEIFRRASYTAAHRNLPFGTKVRVKNLKNGREIVVRINNRGPFVKGRIIDLSEQAAKDIGMCQSGVVPVEVAVLSKETAIAPVIATR
jgi:rare lipoprotein A